MCVLMSVMIILTFDWLILFLLQISTCMQVHLQTSWAKTQRSHAPLALPLTSTTYAQTSPKTTGSMVHTFLQISTLTCRVHSKLVIAFSSNFQPPYWYKEPLCALRMVIGIPMPRKQPTYSFSWNFYMNAIAEQGPHLQGNLQCATKFTVLVTQPHNHTPHTHTHKQAQSWHEEGVFSVCIHLKSPVFYSHWWVVVYQQLSPGSKSLHMVSTFHKRCLE